MEQATGDRWKAGAIVAIVHAGLGAALLFGLAGQSVRIPDPVTHLFDLRPPPPPPPRERPQVRPHVARHAGAASPRNLRAKAAEVVTPPPVVALVVPPPIVTAPVAGPGAASHAGASDRPGPGSGSGGRGNGSGSGGEGQGDGDDTPPRRIRGFSNDDYPRDLGSSGIGGTVGVRYTVEVDGHASNCRVTRSSGSAELDALTCRLIERRFRLVPSRDADGRPVRSTIVEEHSWEVDRLPRPDEGDPPRE